MRLILAVATFLAFVPTARAELTDSGANSLSGAGMNVANVDGTGSGLKVSGNDSGTGGGDKQFSHIGEFRVRYLFNDNQSGSSSLTPHNGNTVDQRLTLGGTYKASEKFAVTAKFADSASWGSSDLYVYNSLGAPGTWSSGNNGAQTNGVAAANLLMVQEAYASWLVSDDFLLRFGRGLLQLGDGSVVGTNDYEPTPNSFDGVLGTYDMDFGRISAWVVKFAVYDNGMAAKMQAAMNPAYQAAVKAGLSPGISGNNSSDPEADAYGISFDLKKMPEWLKMVNVHLIENVKDTTPGALAAPTISADPLATMGQNILRYGINVGGSASIIDYKVDAEGMTGTYFCEGPYAVGCTGFNGVTTTTAIQRMDANAYMAQVEAGVNFPEFMKARIFARYHVDSGDSSSAANMKNINTYDPYYYNKIDGSGLMEVVGWGNLTFYNAGLTVMPTDQTTIGLQYFMFQKTNAQGRMNAGMYGDMVGLTSPNSSALGQEFDLWAEHKYDGGFSILTRAGMFMPGDSIKRGISDDPVAITYLVPASVFPAGTTRDSIYTQVMVQGKMTF